MIFPRPARGRSLSLAGLVTLSVALAAGSASGLWSHQADPDASLTTSRGAGEPLPATVVSGTPDTVLPAGAGSTSRHLTAPGIDSVSKVPATSSRVVAGAVYLSPHGSDSNSGTRTRPWRTLAYAASRLRPGKTLYVRGGTYPGESIYWTKSGTASAPITIINYPGERPVFNGNGHDVFLVIQGSTSYVSFNGLTITNFHPTDAGVVEVIDSANHIGLNRLTMTGNRGSTRRDHLIYLGASSVRYVRISNSYLDGMSGGAIHMYHSPNAQHVQIDHNVVRNCFWGVIVTSDAAYITINHNTFVNNERGVEVWTATHVQITNNIFIAPARMGIMPLYTISLLEDYNLFDMGPTPYLYLGSFLSLGSWRAATGLGRHSRIAAARLDSHFYPRAGSGAIRRASDGRNIGAH